VIVVQFFLKDLIRLRNRRRRREVGEKGARSRKGENNDVVRGCNEVGGERKDLQ